MSRPANRGTPTRSFRPIFYKPGNLFGTYLERGHKYSRVTKGPRRPQEGISRSSTVWCSGTEAHRCAAFEAAESHVALADFVTSYVGPRDLRKFAVRICEANGIKIM